jgi:hypothetical protein
MSKTTTTTSGSTELSTVSTERPFMSNVYSDYAESKINEALTPLVLSVLAAKGISAEQARNHLRTRIGQDVARFYCDTVAR